MGLSPDRLPPGRSRRRRPSRGIGVNPLSWFMRWANWFEARGVYQPGEENRGLSTWRDFGWLIAGWLVAVSAFVVFFAIVS